MPGVTDWLSTISGVVAAVIALVTLFTVYVAALQLLSQRKAYRHSLSYSALGPWRSKVFKSSLFGLRSSVSTPSISLAKLIEERWNPAFAFPLGIPRTKPKKRARASFRDVEKAKSSMVLARSGWVNFMQGLGLSCKEEKFFEMQYEAALLNGCVPMRWRGPDLVGLCAMLGFQSHEKTPSFSTPMALPMQWSGPLGWVQFRDGFEGCVAEFRRRTIMINQLSEEIHNYYQTFGVKNQSTLVPRLCYSLGGLCADVNGENNLFYIGPWDAERTIEYLLEGVRETADKKDDKDTDAKSEDHESDRGSNASKTSSDSDDDSDSSSSDGGNSVREVFTRLEKNSIPDEEMLEKVWGLQPLEIKKRGLGVKKGEVRGELIKSAPDEARKRHRKEKGLREALVPCPGILSVVIQGEVATSCGIDLTKCVEYHRVFSYFEEVRAKQHPYRMGNMVMDRATLKLFKSSLLKLKPDGFYFTPTGVLSADITDIYTHVRVGLFGLDQVCSEFSSAAWNRSKDLFWAAKLCNEMQQKRRKARVIFSVNDMGIISKASLCLQKNANASDQLFWSLLVCPALFQDVMERLKGIDAGSLKLLLDCGIQIKNEVLVCPELTQVAKKSNEEANEKANDDDRSEVSIEVDRQGRTGDGEVDYAVPECAEGDFSGMDMVGAFLNVCLTFFWIEKRWISDVSIYTAAIPPTVMML
jgi:hypothetical protein